MNKMAAIAQCPRPPWWPRPPPVFSTNDKWLFGDSGRTRKESEKRLRPPAVRRCGRPQTNTNQTRESKLKRQFRSRRHPSERRSTEVRKDNPWTRGRKRLDNRFIFHLLNTEDQSQPPQTGHVTTCCGQKEPEKPEKTLQGEAGWCYRKGEIYSS